MSHNGQWNAFDWKGYKIPFCRSSHKLYLAHASKTFITQLKLDPYVVKRSKQLQANLPKLKKSGNKFQIKNEKITPRVDSSIPKEQPKKNIESSHDLSEWKLFKITERITRLTLDHLLYFNLYVKDSQTMLFSCNNS